MSDFQQTITSLDLLHTSLYRMELFMNAQAVKNAKTDVISLISRLEKAERERDDLRAELARRDATEVEPVGFVHESQLARIKPECGVTAWIRTSPGDGDIPIYTAASPAVLPQALDNWHNSASGVMQSLQFKGDEMSFIAGANWMREQCLALGAQQQKVVELYKRKSMEVISGQRYSYVLLEDLLPELDAAGVKWEVKK